MSKVFICMPVYNRLSYTLKCIESIKNSVGVQFQIIICDHGSTDNTSKTIQKKFPEIIIVKGSDNLWWTGATNLTIKKAVQLALEEDFIFTLNNDTELLPDTLMILLKMAKKHKKTIIGAVNVFYDNPLIIEPSAFKQDFRFRLFPRIHNRIHEWGQSLDENLTMEEVNSLSGKGVLLPVNIFNEIGYYNEQLLPHYHADTEFTTRANQNGYKIYLNYEAKILSHQEQSGFGTATSDPSIRMFVKSFYSIKSANHFKTLLNRSKLLYDKSWFWYLSGNVLAIIFGFIIRKYKFHFR